LAVAFTILLIVAGNAYAAPDKDGDGMRNDRDTCLRIEENGHVAYRLEASKLVGSFLQALAMRLLARPSLR
jgi:hypothetical protein